MRILLVEDNRPLSEWLALALQRQNYTVDCIYDGEDADHLLLTQQYDLIILDIALPKLNGDKVLQRLRKRNNDVPVLVLTANNAVESRIGALNTGADDYMAKPFDVSELEARVRALLRRSNRHASPLLQCGSLVYDSNSRIFMLGAVQLCLTPREQAVLETLIVKMGRTVSKQALAESLFAMDEEISPDAIEVYIHRLRKKLEHGDAAIITLRGLGYLLKPQNETA
ncbi:response regulator [Oxalobacteraceae bacterium CAVE-383]|nr:response regulator [Oxalobacteraceae bacterium CAVE-383]